MHLPLKDLDYSGRIGDLLLIVICPMCAGLVAMYRVCCWGCFYKPILGPSYMATTKMMECELLLRAIIIVRLVLILLILQGYYSDFTENTP